jgi:CRISPR-associated protein Cas5a/b/c
VSEIEREIADQPSAWERAREVAGESAHALPAPGQRVAAVGCGTSWFMAQAFAALREGRHHGETDAFPASEMPADRRYDLVVAITRSGTTTEVLRLLGAVGKRTRTTVVTADRASLAARGAGEAIALPFADERSVVQTRFATSALALLRAHVGDDLLPAIRDAETAVEIPIPLEPARYRQFVSLGRGWTVGLAHEAALKIREATGAWAESYPAMEYRHGPISAAGSQTHVWMLQPEDPDLVRDVRATGATVRVAELDPMAELILVQRTVVALAEARGLDPDRPRHLARSVVLS